MHIIEVRKPSYTFKQRFLKWLYGYSYKLETWQKSLPNDGDKIKLTWVPNPVNNPREKSCYIGTEGFVFDMDKNTGSFRLRMQSGATLINTGHDFDYTKL